MLQNSSPPMRPKWATDEVLDTIDSKLAIMQNTVGVTLTEEECTLLRNSLKHLKRRSANASEETCTSIMLDVIKDKIETDMCYLWLLACLPSAMSVSEDTFKTACDILKSKLGKKPSGTDVITELVLVECVFNGTHSLDDLKDDSVSLLLNQNIHLETMRAMMASKTTYAWSEESGLVHLSEANASCDCSEVLCDHGWAARFVLCMLSRDGCIIGGYTEFNLSDILESEEINVEVSDGGSNLEQTNLSRDLESDLVRMMSEHLETRTTALEEALNQLKELRDSKPMAQSHTTDSSTEDDDDDTIMPLDSSTNLGRYTTGKRFMRPGSVFSPEISRSDSTKLPEVVVRKPQSAAPKTLMNGSRELTLSEGEMMQAVVRGFMMTPQMRQREQEEAAKVSTINGLANPFKNQRLNFLCHFHTALVDVASSGHPLDMLTEWSRMEPRNPTENLLKLVVSRTFDFDNAEVKANIFKLPYIEVGMELTDRNLMTCFASIRSEYQNLWFDEMKCLNVPSFSSDFNTRSKDPTRRHSRHTGRTRSDSTTSSSSSDTRKDTGRSARRREGSILGFTL